MYCTHCGYHLKDKKREKILDKSSCNTRKSDTEEVFFCPRCNHLIKDNLSIEEIKHLAMASHSEIHKSRNKLNTGKSFTVISIILLIIGFLFLTLSFKSNNFGKFEPNCTEFYVFCALMGVGVCLLTSGIILLVYGSRKKREYEGILKDIQDEVFYQ